MEITERAQALEFDAAFRLRLKELFAWRRDVRRFRDTPLTEAIIDDLLAIACRSPSVGNCQPWRFVKVKNAAARAGVRAAFETYNARALAAYEGPRAQLYAGLKLSGFDCAPVQLAVFAAPETEAGHGRGRTTMPETLVYSVVLAIHTFWLAARARGIGVGWVSILDPAAIARLLGVPPAWQLVGYLCVGWPEDEHDAPELARQGWQARLELGRFVTEI